MSPLAARADKAPVVTLTGPRQAGKTTLCRQVFPDHAYLTLEDPDTQQFALRDARGFLRQAGGRVILDEIQRAPQLLSYIQGIVDERKSPGDFIITGSQQLGLAASVSQTLAGRTAVLDLLPLSLDEVWRFPHAPRELYEVMRLGGYPRILDERLRPEVWLADYVRTYVERDVRQLINVQDLATFQAFLRLCAGRSGQVLNLASLGADCGITHNTAKAWVSVLEASFIAMRLPAYHRSVRKRLVRRPKLLFLDTGLLCFLLGIHDAQTLSVHPLRGAIFETWVAAEIIKHCTHRGMRPRVYHYSEHGGTEVDLILEWGMTLMAVESKSSATVGSDFHRNLDRFGERFAGDPMVNEVAKYVVYGGDETQRRTGWTALPWSEIQSVAWAE